MKLFDSFRPKLLVLTAVIAGLPLLIMTAIIVVLIINSTAETFPTLISLLIITGIMLILEVIFSIVTSKQINIVLVDFGDKLSSSFTDEEIRAIQKSSEGKEYLMLANSMTLFGEKKADNDQLVRIINEHTSARDMSNDIFWHKEKGEEHFLLNIPDIWRKNYPSLTLKRAVRLYELLDKTRLQQTMSAFARCEAALDRRFEIKTQLKVTADKYIKVIIRGRSVMGENDKITVVGSIIDIDERLQLEDAIQENYAMYRFALQAVTDIIYEVDLEKNSITIANPNRWEQLFGEKPDRDDYTAFRKKYWDKIHQDYKESYLDRYFNFDHILLLPDKSLSYEYRIENRENDYIWVSHVVTVVSERSGIARKLIGQISNINEKKRLEMKIVYQSIHDSLTGCYLRSAIRKEYSIVAKSGRTNFALLIVDIDNFSQINNQYGHTIGDYALRFLVSTLWAKQLTSCAVGRIGNDEFAVLVREVTEKSRPERMAQLVLEKFGSPVQLENGSVINMSVSIGIAECSGKDDSYEDMYRRATTALGEAKEKGGGIYIEQQPQSENNVNSDNSPKEELKQ